MKKYFILYANCIPVKGFSRSIICDLQSRKFEFIPNDLFSILTKYKKLSINEIIDVYGIDNKEVVDDYYSFLEKNDFGFWSENLIPELVPLSLRWDSPQTITNALIDVNRNSDLPFKKICEELDELNCSALELRFFYSINFKELNKILLNFIRSTLRSINILVEYSNSYTESSISKLLKKHSRVFQINISNSPFYKNVRILNDSVSVNYFELKINSNSCCGKIHPKYFSINIEHFTESISNNTCLNRKIAIDEYGEIKNCPSMSKGYGKIKNTTLQEAINHIDFKKYWAIKKDQVAICKDCEFRYICTDCRVYIQNKEDIYSKPKKCNYNPYTTKWE